MQPEKEPSLLERKITKCIIAGAMIFTATTFYYFNTPPEERIKLNDLKPNINYSQIAEDIEYHATELGKYLKLILTGEE
jgi:hypothetical protein